MLYQGTCFIYLFNAVTYVLLCLACVALQHLGKLHLLCLLAATYNELTSRILSSASIFSLCTHRLTEREAVEYLKKRDQSEIEQVLVKLSFFVWISKLKLCETVFSFWSICMAWLLREWLHWKFRLTVSLRQQPVLPVFENKVLKNVFDSYNKPTWCTVFSLYFGTTLLHVSGPFVAHHQAAKCIMWQWCLSSFKATVGRPGLP
jgi:hypothetical protein